MIWTIFLVFPTKNFRFKLPGGIFYQESTAIHLLQSTDHTLQQLTLLHLLLYPVHYTFLYTANLKRGGSVISADWSGMLRPPGKLSGCFPKVSGNVVNVLFIFVLIVVGIAFIYFIKVSRCYLNFLNFFLYIYCMISVVFPPLPWPNSRPQISYERRDSKKPSIPKQLYTRKYYCIFILADKPFP